MLLNLSLLGSLSWPWLVFTLRRHWRASARLLDGTGRCTRSDIDSGTSDE